jgi:hypothetical protein
VIHSLAAGKTLPFATIGKIELLGAKDALKWSRDAKGLTVQMPPAKPCDYAVVLKITDARR